MALMTWLTQDQWHSTSEDYLYVALCLNTCEKCMKCHPVDVEQQCFHTGHFLLLSVVTDGSECCLIMSSKVTSSKRFASRQSNTYFYDKRHIKRVPHLPADWVLQGTVLGSCGFRLAAADLWWSRVPSLNKEFNFSFLPSCLLRYLGFYWKTLQLLENSHTGGDKTCTWLCTFSFLKNKNYCFILVTHDVDFCLLNWFLLLLQTSSMARGGSPSELTIIWTTFLNCLTPCTDECSFSTIRRIKTYLRLMMNEERPNRLASLNIHKDVASILFVTSPRQAVINSTSLQFKVILIHSDNYKQHRYDPHTHCDKAWFPALCRVQRCKFSAKARELERRKWTVSVQHCATGGHSSTLRKEYLVILNPAATLICP